MYNVMAVTSTLGSDRIFLLPYLRYVSPFTKIYGLLQLIIIHVCTFTLLCYLH